MGGWRHESRTEVGSARASGMTGAPVQTLLALLIAVGAAVVCGLCAEPAVARDPRDPVTLGTGIRVQDPVKDLTRPQQRAFPKAKGGIFGPAPRRVDQAAPLYLQGDELIYDTQNKRVIAVGNVEIVFNEYILTADRVVYDQAAQTLTAEGNAQLKEPNGNVVKADRLTATDDFREAFVQALSVTARDQSRITARRAIRRDGSVTEFEDGKFTPCKADGARPPLWCISAARVVHDQVAGSVTHYDAKFEFFGVPVLYLPYFTHPDPSVKRRSGFLTPEVRQSSTLGFTAEVPYFFALAPHYDFTFHPMFTSLHGILWQGEWRHKVAFGDVRGTYSVKLAGIDQDIATLPAPAKPSLDGWRGSVQTKGLFSLASWWRFGWDVTIESDDSFRRTYKLDSVLQTDRVNTMFLQGLSERNYLAFTLYHFGGLLLDEPPHASSWVHPVIDYRYVFDQPVFGGELSFAGNAIALSRKNGTDLNRASFEARWRKRVVDGIGQVWTPQLQLRGDATHFRNGFNPDLGLPIDQETVTRAMAVAALTYSYPFAMHVAAGTHIIEPTAQIVTRTHHASSQRPLPNEDARSLVWDDTLLFDLDKFSGWDRIETGTRANIGLQYSFQSAGGGSARLIAGQSIHLSNANPFANPGQLGPGPNDPYIFNPRSGLESQRSDYVLGAYLAPAANFRLVTQARFDERDLSLRRNDIFTSFSAGPLTALAQYTYFRFNPELPTHHAQQELQLGGSLRLSEHWSILGGIRFDLDEGTRLQDTIQLRYADDCFVLTASYSESFITNPVLGIEPDRTFMLRVEFKHLGNFALRSNVTSGILTENQPPN